MATYNPLNSYPLVLKICPDEFTAPTSTALDGWWVCANPVGGTGNGCYDAANSPGTSVPCFPFLNCWPSYPFCNSICPQSIVSPDPPSAAPPPPPPVPASSPGTPPPAAGTNVCSVYTSIDIWWRYTQNDAGQVSTTPIADCYPVTNPDQGCPVMPGQCYFWNNTAAQPVCVVERLLDYPTGRPKQPRNLYYCSTCDDPVTSPWSPNGLADIASPTFPATPPYPDPWPVTSNPTGSMCTDCEQVWDGNFHCLHPNDPTFNNPNTCVELSASTVLQITNPGPNQEYWGTNGTNTYQLSNAFINGTMIGCEAGCIGGCVQQFSGLTPACNFNPTAAYDDGSCCFSLPCTACGDATATNYCFSCCTIDNTLCLYPGEGCMDDTADPLTGNTDINGFASCGPSANQLCEYCDYDPAAYISTPCCNVRGCMNAICNTTGGGFVSLAGFYDCGPSNNLPYLYPNYDPTACCAGPCCTDFGCTDCGTIWEATQPAGTFCNGVSPATTPGATNYDPNACWGDGSCTYPPSWNCDTSNGTCSDPGTGNGAWNASNGGQAACQANCIADSWNCSGAPNWVCSDPGTGNGTYSSLSSCNNNCPIDSWDCSGAPNWNCSDPGNGLGQYTTLGNCNNNCPVASWDCISPGNCQNPGNGLGQYSTWGACNTACPPETWECDSPGNCISIFSWTAPGPYSSLIACEDYCTPTWNCIPCVPYIPGVCVLLMGGVGAYTSLAACQAVCNDILPSWNCILGICSDPGCGGGTYSSLLACQAVCNAVIPCEPPPVIQTAGDNSPDCDDTMTLLNSGISTSPPSASEWALQNVPTVDWADMYFLGTQPISSSPPNLFCNDGTYIYNNNLVPSFSEPGGIYVTYPFHNSLNWTNALNYLNTQYQTLGNGSQATTTPFNTSMNFTSIVQMMRDTCPFHTIDWEDGTSFLFIRYINLNWSHCHCTNSYGMEVCYDYDMWMAGTSPFPSLQALLLHWVNMYALPSMGGYIISTSGVQDLIDRCCPPGPPPWGDWCPCNWR